jgi:hypothetical protein
LRMTWCWEHVGQTEQRGARNRIPVHGFPPLSVEIIRTGTNARRFLEL